MEISLPEVSLDCIIMIFQFIHLSNIDWAYIMYEIALNEPGYNMIASIYWAVTKHKASCRRFTPSCIILQQPCEVEALLSLISTRKLKCRDVKQLAQGRTTSNCLELGFDFMLADSRDRSSTQLLDMPGPRWVWQMQRGMPGPFRRGCLTEDTSPGECPTRGRAVGGQRPWLPLGLLILGLRGYSCLLSFSCGNSDSRQSQGPKQQEYKIPSRTL